MFVSWNQSVSAFKGVTVKPVGCFGSHETVEVVLSVTSNSNKRYKKDLEIRAGQSMTMSFENIHFRLALISHNEEGVKVDLKKTKRPSKLKSKRKVTTVRKRPRVFSS